MENISISDTQQISIEKAFEYLLNKIEYLINTEKRDFVSIGLTGGSLIKLLTQVCKIHKEKLVKYALKLKFFFGDERFVPFTSDDSTYKGYVDLGFFAELGIPQENVFPINPNTGDIHRCADDYETRLQGLLNKQNGFDILILGMGPDGHICSLFPGHRLFTEPQTRLVAAIGDSPKPPPERVTLTLPYINNSRFIMFCSYGESKAQILKRILVEKDTSLPAASVKATNENAELKWYLDKEAAKLL
jgi:6-phosphogluconolactonase